MLIMLNFLSIEYFEVAKNYFNELIILTSLHKE